MVINSVRGEMMEEIIRFQENMLLIRRAVGWTAEELGDRIGVTRQTINNLEKNNRNKFKLNKTQYIAIRSVLDAEIARCPEETEVLRLILDMLVDHPENYSEEQKNVLKEKANIIAPSILAGTASRQAASKEIIATVNGSLGAAFAAGAVAGIIGGPIGAAGLAGAAIGSWLLNITKTGKKK